MMLFREELSEAYNTMMKLKALGNMQFFRTWNIC
jgi:hypothetical protein